MRRTTTSQVQQNVPQENGIPQQGAQPREQFIIGDVVHPQTANGHNFAVLNNIGSGQDGVQVPQKLEQQNWVLGQGAQGRGQFHMGDLVQMVNGQYNFGGLGSFGSEQDDILAEQGFLNHQDPGHIDYLRNM